LILRFAAPLIGLVHPFGIGNETEYAIFLIMVALPYHVDLVRFEFCLHGASHAFFIRKAADGFGQKNK
jgi:hypothetical protein